MVEVEMSMEAQRQLDELHGTIHVRVLKLIERLADWPEVSGVKPLRGKLAGHYRLRTGDYRLQFHLENNRIIIEKIGHRDGFYQE